MALLFARASFGRVCTRVPGAPSQGWWGYEPPAPLSAGGALSEANRPLTTFVARVGTAASDPDRRGS